MKTVKITQKNIRLLLSSKIAATVGLLAKEKRCSLDDAQMSFYQSKTYALLERENTKYWWMSPLQLFREYIYMKQNNVPENKWHSIKEITDYLEAHRKNIYVWLDKRKFHGIE